MNGSTVLVLGSGGREHALARRLAASPNVARVVVAPGNGGIADDGSDDGTRVTRRAVDLADVSAVVALAKTLGAALVVVGPEAPRVAGVAAALDATGIAVFGPSKEAARPRSKVFLKAFAVGAGIPTAKHDVATMFEEAERILRARGAPIVVKADGLCAGKGVVVASTVDEAIAAARGMLVDRVFGDAGAVVVIEDAIPGREVSVHAICDGERFLRLPPARDHKRVFDGDRGPNTGGMGAICPARDVDAELLERIDREILEPTLRGMKARGTPFRGVLFAGIMITPEGAPILLEHNVRFGDPECEALMELVEGDVAGLLTSAAKGALEVHCATVDADRSAVVVVLAAQGYPERPIMGAPITALDHADATGAKIHHAGTKRVGDALVVSGGRVLAVTASDHDPEVARTRAYAAAETIQFEGKHFRRDIGRTV
ncbi:MAG: phosphoribosylamine--glycine ligase [Polyangiaceae bacterium]